MKELFTKEIKAHIKHDIEVSPDTYGDWERFLKGFKIDRWSFREEKSYKFGNRAGQLLIFDVVAQFKAKKYEDNRCKWQVNVYQDGDIGVYFDGTFYEEV